MPSCRQALIRNTCVNDGNMLEGNDTARWEEGMLAEK